jgi:hypothetical protein
MREGRCIQESKERGWRRKPTIVEISMDNDIPFITICGKISEY